GADVTRLLAYPDHYEYTAADSAHIMRRADRTLIVTTAKDAVKLRALLPELSLHVVEQELVFESSEEALMTALDNVL
ncbi:MAG TPA: tetraacyldisaccharide 4'-kinase, partial [Longimicrobiales bacterium]